MAADSRSGYAEHASSRSARVARMPASMISLGRRAVVPDMAAH
jgi:hypothetical protein